MSTRGRSRRSRIAALALLGALALSFAPRSSVAQPRTHCPPPASGSAVTMPMSDCGHAGDPACASLPGCAAPVSALTTAAFGIVVSGDIARVAATPFAGLPGRLRTGPPTPPPNS